MTTFVYTGQHALSELHRPGETEADRIAAAVPRGEVYKRTLFELLPDRPLRCVRHDDGTGYCDCEPVDLRIGAVEMKAKFGVTEWTPEMRFP